MAASLEFHPHSLGNIDKAFSDRSEPVYLYAKQYLIFHTKLSQGNIKIA